MMHGMPSQHTQWHHVALCDVGGSVAWGPGAWGAHATYCSARVLLLAAGLCRCCGQAVRRGAHVASVSRLQLWPTFLACIHVLADYFTNHHVYIMGQLLRQARLGRQRACVHGGSCVGRTGDRKAVVGQQGQRAGSSLSCGCCLRGWVGVRHSTLMSVVSD